MFATNMFSILGLGFVLGLKHATDADHLIAVSTIVSERNGIWSSSIVGAVWGLGHTLSLLLVGLMVVTFQVQIPERIALGMELLVAVMLVILGTKVLLKLKRGAKLHAHEHVHGGRRHVHLHLHEAGKQPSHNHLPTVGKKPFLVGMVHGLAGSAALMLVVLATISSRSLALLYIGVFGLGSVGGMIVMSLLIGLPFGLTSRIGRLNNVVRFFAGVTSVCFGLFYAWSLVRG